MGSKGIRVGTLFLFLLIVPSSLGVLSQEADTSGSTQSAEPPPGEEPKEAPPEFVPPAPGGVPEEYLAGANYLGNFLKAWRLNALSDPVLSKVFLAVESGATREALTELDVPDLDLALDDLITSRMVRKIGNLYRPAFPVIHQDSGKAFDEAVRKAADGIYPELRPLLKKAAKASKKEKVSPWLFTLLWSETFESESAEEMLVDAGALDARRMRDEGYLWIQIPAHPRLLGVERYSSGTETLQYVWTALSYLTPAVENFHIRRQILDGALSHVPWGEKETEETVKEFGILDGKKRVKVPALRKDSRLLTLLRQTSQLYTKRALAALRTDALAKELQVPRDEAFAAAFTTLGFSMMQRLELEGLARAPDYLFREFSPSSGLVEALAVTADPEFRPLKRSYYLYDGLDFAGSIRQAEECLKTHPGDPDALFRKGIGFMKLRKYPEALAAFEEGIALPASADDVWKGWFLIRAGNTLDVLERRDEALVRYERALQYADVGGSHETARVWLESVYRD
jgi:tetratricopeptide (TPR) repeat protein